MGGDHGCGLVEGCFLSVRWRVDGVRSRSTVWHPQEKAGCGGVYLSRGGSTSKLLYLETVITVARQLYFIVISLVPGILEGLLWLARPGKSAEAGDRETHPSTAGTEMWSFAAQRSLPRVHLKVQQTALGL